MVAIRAKNLRKVYRTRFRRDSIVAVDDLSLEVAEGEVFGFLGLNGAGKTTSVMMLLGCVQPTSGEAEIFGEPVGNPDSRRFVGFLPEKFRFHEFLTPTELLRLHGRLAGLSPEDCSRRIPGLLERVGLGERANALVKTFSKGMQQRLGLAQALIADPKLVILDEPTSALDPLGRREVRDIILELKADGKSVFINSHLLSEIELCCDRVAILHRGQLVRQGNLKELLSGRTCLEIRASGVSSDLQTRLCAFGNLIQTGDHLWELTLGEDSDVPQVAETLVSGGAAVHALLPHRESLEDFFIRVVGEDDRPMREDGNALERMNVALERSDAELNGEGNSL